MASATAGHNAATGDHDQSIALRRSKRRASIITSPTKAGGYGKSSISVSTCRGPATPSKHGVRKRVRFSDPGLSMGTSSSMDTINIASSSTGLTPHVSRTSLFPSSASGCTRSPSRTRSNYHSHRVNRRRASTPSIGSRSISGGEAAAATTSTMTVAEPIDSLGRTDLPVEIQFAPFRQILDARSRRRLRRNGLSEEMNEYNSEVLRERSFTAASRSLSRRASSLDGNHGGSNNNNDENDDDKAEEEEEEAEDAMVTSWDDTPVTTPMECTSMDGTDEDHALHVASDIHDMNDAARQLDMQLQQTAQGQEQRQVNTTPDLSQRKPLFAAKEVTMKTTTTQKEGAVEERQQRPMHDQHGIDIAADEDLLVMALELESSKREKRRLFNQVQPYLPDTPAPCKTGSLEDTDLIVKAKDFSDSQGQNRQDEQDEESSMRNSTCSINTSASSELPSPPPSFFASLSKTLKSALHRAESSEEALKALEHDLFELGFGTDMNAEGTGQESSGRQQPPATSLSSSDLVQDIQAHFQVFRQKLSQHLVHEERRISGANRVRDQSLALSAIQQQHRQNEEGNTDFTIEGPAASLLTTAISKLQELSRRVDQREAELLSMQAQHRTLKTNFEHSLRASDGARQRIAELEKCLEDAQANSRSRRLDQPQHEVRADDHDTDEASDLLHVRMEMQKLERENAEKDRTIDSLIRALERYRDEVNRLEGLVSALEKQVEEARQESRDQQDVLCGIEKAREEETAVAETTIRELKFAVEQANDNASALQIRISSLEAAQQQEGNGEEEKRVAESDSGSDPSLRARITALSTALTTSQSETARLEGLVCKLRSRLRVNDDASQHAIDASWNELVRSVTKCHEERKRWIRAGKVRRANWDMEDEKEEQEVERRMNGGGGNGEPMTPVSLVRFADMDEVGGDDDDDDDDDNNGDDGDGDDHVQGRIQIARGSSSSRRSHRASRSHSRHYYLRCPSSPTSVATNGLGIDLDLAPENALASPVSSDMSRSGNNSDNHNQTIKEKGVTDTLQQPHSQVEGVTGMKTKTGTRKAKKKRPRRDNSRLDSGIGMDGTSSDGEAEEGGDYDDDENLLPSSSSPLAQPSQRQHHRKESVMSDDVDVVDSEADREMDMGMDMDMQMDLGAMGGDFDIYDESIGGYY